MPASHPALSEAELRGLIRSEVRAAIEDLSGRRGVTPSLIQIVRAGEAVWGDSSLGCPEPGKSYAQVLTPGTWLILSHDQQEFDYRATDSQVLLCTREPREKPLEYRPLKGL